MCVNEIDLRIRVLLSVQRALIGEVTSQMRFIAVDFSSDRINIIVWHDGAVDEPIIDEFDAGAVSKVEGDFLFQMQVTPPVTFEFLRCDFPKRPDFRGTLVYGRNETSPQQCSNDYQL